MNVTERFHSRGHSIYANLLEQKKAFTQEKSSIPTGLVRDTNLAAVTSCGNTLYITYHQKNTCRRPGVAAAMESDLQSLIR